MQYKLYIRRIGKECREIYTYNNIDKALDYFELEVGNPTIDHLELIDTSGTIHGSWGSGLRRNSGVHFRVYLVDENHVDDCPSTYSDEKFKQVAEEQGFVFSLGGFEKQWNDTALDVDQDYHWIRIL